MSGNKNVKDRMIAIYGEECFIDKLHLRDDNGTLRNDSESCVYKGKGQYKKMQILKQITYHHIKEKSKGGQATIENGALLSAGNHAWLNEQSKKNQELMNIAFQIYKALVNPAIYRAIKERN